MNKKKSFLLLLLLCTMTFAMGQESSDGGHRLKVGLVLGGGGAKGAAEVGALKIIEKAGIPIDYIAGTSIGAIVGGLYSVGYRAEALDSMFRSQEWMTLLADRDEKYKGKVISKEKGITYIFGFPVSRKGSSKSNSAIGAIRGDNIVELLYKMTHLRDAVDFDKLPIPFRCVATDIMQQKEVVLSHGSLPMSMRASMAIPGVFKPVIINKKTLVDGGMLNNLPVDVVKSMGADVVIAIDLTQNKQESRDFSLKGLTGIGGLVDWFVSRPDIDKYNENIKQVDVYINPDLKDYGVTSFSASSISDMIDLGYKSAKSSWDEIMKLKEVVEKGVKPEKK
jgi:NTE family protein